jgi:hypothetical protein
MQTKIRLFTGIKKLIFAFELYFQHFSGAMDH